MIGPTDLLCLFTAAVGGWGGGQGGGRGRGRGGGRDGGQGGDRGRDRGRGQGSLWENQQGRPWETCILITPVN